MKRRSLLRLLGIELFGTAIAPFYTNPAAAATLLPQRWGYRGDNSPEHWGELSPEFQLCQTGQQQTPINLGPTTTIEAASLDIHYQPTPLAIANTGRTIQVNYQSGSFFTFKGDSFALLQFHFHHPSEHHFAGQAFDLEIHLVHRAPTGKLAVIGILAQAGALNSAIQPIWKAMPTQPLQDLRQATTLVNATDLLPRDRRFYEYQGSLTTPPCSEAVLWLIMAQPISLSVQQIQQFARLFPQNARPLQPLGDRVIRRSLAKE
ncbi:MAG: carbonic anhydrase family protein [Leptolyngbyaceae cyanobacterium bins.349]|nr:carbonic anhydrase family protein [Leptolyngbyaceae cyanobacterium bins.349]